MVYKFETFTLVSTLIPVIIVIPVFPYDKIAQPVNIITIIFFLLCQIFFNTYISYSRKREI